MGILSKFGRKKKPSFNLPSRADKETMPTSPPPSSFGSPSRFSAEPAARPSFTSVSSGSSGSHDLILTKLDLLDQRLQNIDRRLAVIEKIAKESQE